MENFGSLDLLYDLLTEEQSVSTPEQFFDYTTVDQSSVQMAFFLRGAIGTFKGTIQGTQVDGHLLFISGDPVTDPLGRTVKGYRYKTEMFFKTLYLFFTADPIRSGKFAVAMYDEPYTDFPRLVASADRTQVPLGGLTSEPKGTDSDVSFKNKIFSDGRRCGHAQGGTQQYIQNTDKHSSYIVTIKTKWHRGTDYGDYESEHRLRAGGTEKLGCSRGSGMPPITSYSRKVVGEEKLR